jgi:hypothetical protein
MLASRGEGRGTRGDPNDIGSPRPGEPSSSSRLLPSGAPSPRAEPAPQAARRWLRGTFLPRSRRGRAPPRWAGPGDPSPSERPTAGLSGPSSPGRSARGGSPRSDRRRRDRPAPLGGVALSSHSDSQNRDEPLRETNLRSSMATSFERNENGLPAQRRTLLPYFSVRFGERAGPTGIATPAVTKRTTTRGAQTYRSNKYARPDPRNSSSRDGERGRRPAGPSRGAPLLGAPPFAAGSPFAAER